MIVSSGLRPYDNCAPSRGAGKLNTSCSPRRARRRGRCLIRPCLTAHGAEGAIAEQVTAESTTSGEFPAEPRTSGSDPLAARKDAPSLSLRQPRATSIGGTALQEATTQITSGLSEATATAGEIPARRKIGNSYRTGTG